MANDVLQNYNRIVHDKADAKRQGHERKIIQAKTGRYITARCVINEIMIARVGITVATRRRRKRDNQHHQSDAEQEREPTSCGLPDRRGTIDENFQLDSSRKLSTQVGKQ